MRAGYAVGAPLFVIAPNSAQKSGIFYEVVTSAANRLGMSVQWNEEVGYGQMIEGLNAGRYDIIGSGVWINSDRAKGADFTVPIFYDAIYAFARPGDKRFQEGLTRLNSSGFVISTMDGELGATIAKQDFPNARTLQLPQNSDFSQMIENVVEGKADVVFLASGAGRDYQRANPGKLAIISPSRPVRIFPNAIMLPKGQYDLKQTLDYVILEMQNDGEVDRILDRYEKVPGSFLRVAKPYR